VSKSAGVDSGSPSKFVVNSSLKNGRKKPVKPVIHYIVSDLIIVSVGAQSYSIHPFLRRHVYLSRNPRDPLSQLTAPTSETFAIAAWNKSLTTLQDVQTSKDEVRAACRAAYVKDEPVEYELSEEKILESALVSYATAEQCA